MYQRTALGQQEIHDRNFKIPSRTRTLLLLIESYDLEHLDQKIANQENFETLLNLGLIIKKFDQDIQNIKVDENYLKPEEKNLVEIKSANNRDPLTHTKNIGYSQQNNMIDAVQQDLTVNYKIAEEEHPPLNFQDIKVLMQNTLKQYCGLMAKHLIQAIAEAKTIQELRFHQKKWLTQLFETRISRQNLTELKQYINQSIEHIEKHVQYLE